MTWLGCGSNKNYLQTLCHCETVFELGYEETIINSRMQAVKGHLISEQICEDIDFPKSQRKYCEDFCPNL